jgi:hypothetical protein
MGLMPFYILFGEAPAQMFAYFLIERVLDTTSLSDT